MLLCAKRSSGASRRPQVAGGSGALVFAAEGLGLRPCIARCTARSLALGHGKRPSRSTWQGEWLLDPRAAGDRYRLWFPSVMGLAVAGVGASAAHASFPVATGCLPCPTGSIARPVRSRSWSSMGGRYGYLPLGTAQAGDGLIALLGQLVAAVASSATSPGQSPFPITTGSRWVASRRKLDAHVGAGPGPPAGRAVPRRPCRSRGGHRPCRCAPAATCAGQPGRGTAEQTSVGGPRRRATRLSLPRRTGVSSAA